MIFIFVEDNIARNKTTSQFPVNVQFPSSLTVDGDRRTHSCSILSGSNAWFQLDLGVISNVTTVYIHYGGR